MELNWQVKPREGSKASLFAKELNSSETLAQLLLNRGIEDVDSARRFFLPNLKKLHDPYLLSGMSDAIARLTVALDQKQKILIYGDYDVDGTTATSMLLLFFRRIDHPADFYIPDRLSEGYGMSEKGIRYAKDNDCQLLISVDCGITAVAEVELANQLGIDIIVSDHHEPGEVLPDAIAVLNPKKPDCRYPFKELAGVGVAFKLVQALAAHKGLPDEELVEFMALVAIGSAADIVPLVDENRILVKFGLDCLRRTRNVGLLALIEVTGLTGKEIGTGQVVFVLAPRINAVGRLGDAGRAVRLLTSEDENEAKKIASVLESENRIRREIDEKTLTEAVDLISANFDPQNELVFVLDSDDWHPGVVGIVASRVVERYHRPTIMIAVDNGRGRGSARSIPGFDIFQALKTCEDLMASFGGHKYAAGLTIETQNIGQLKARLAEVASASLTKEMLMPKLWIDVEIDLDDIDPMLIRLMKRMAPFGPQNTRPVFVSRDLQIVGSPTIVGKNHLKFKVRQKGRVLDAIGFNLGDLLYRIPSGEEGVEMAYVIEENEWQGRTTIQLRVKDLH